MTDPTLREWQALTAAMSNLTTELRELRVEMASTYVRRDVYQAESSAANQRILSLESFKDWGVRLVLGAIILALLALVIRQGGLP